MAISFAFAFESSAVRILTAIWDTGVYGNQNDAAPAPASQVHEIWTSNPGRGLLTALPSPPRPRNPPKSLCSPSPPATMLVAPKWDGGPPFFAVVNHGDELSLVVGPSLGD